MLNQQYHFIKGKNPWHPLLLQFPRRDFAGSIFFMIPRSTSPPLIPRRSVVAALVFERNLTGVERPKNINSWLRAQLYKPEYPA